jgi:hypothetical protein
MGEFSEGTGQATERGLVRTAATLIGVQALHQPDLLVEIEAIVEVYVQPEVRSRTLASARVRSLGLARSVGMVERTTSLRGER